MYPDFKLKLLMKIPRYDNIISKKKYSRYREYKFKYSL